jgi:hypothetical protein
MSNFTTTTSDLLDRLLPLMSDRRFHDLQIFCGNGEVVTTSKLLFSAFLPRSVQRELARIDQVCFLKEILFFLLFDLIKIPIVGANGLS